jgi:nucleoid DNA-binding protein
MPKSPSKSQVLAELAAACDLKKSQVAKLFDELEKIMKRSLKANKEFVIHGWLKIAVKSTPAKPARKGMNNLTGQMTTFKAKPAGRKLRIGARKALKDMM